MDEWTNQSTNQPTNLPTTQSNDQPIKPHNYAMNTDINQATKK